ncbi:MAG: DUF4956 domain-containing protein [Ruminococcaceae bacterium]|nr:DUF4956 domain-containing protein [Oscillospiraceae bacterium]
MTFADMFKKSFLEGFTSTDINIYTAAVAMLAASFLAVYVFLVYRILTRKTFYSKNFNISLVGIALITAGIILTIQSSIVVSLGMVGALSIVRFRTAIKDPLDLMFLFWAIAIGIICGVGLAEIAVLLSLILTMGLFILNHIPVAKAPMILVVNASSLDSEEIIMDVVKRYAKNSTVKSRNMSGSSLDLIVELRTSEGNKLVRDIMNLPSVVSASMMTHDGEVTF